MNEPLECIRCHTPMEPGYVPDNVYSGFQQQFWAPGHPIRSFWKGLKMKKEEILPVATFRCPKCGYLESYARPGPTN